MSVAPADGYEKHLLKALPFASLPKDSVFNGDILTYINGSGR